MYYTQVTQRTAYCIINLSVLSVLFFSRLLSVIANIQNTNSAGGIDRWCTLAANTHGHSLTHIRDVCIAFFLSNSFTRFAHCLCRFLSRAWVISSIHNHILANEWLRSRVFNSIHIIIKYAHKRACNTIRITSVCALLCCAVLCSFPFLISTVCMCVRCLSVLFTELTNVQTRRNDRTDQIEMIKSKEIVRMGMIELRRSSGCICWCRRGSERDRIGAEGLNGLKWNETKRKTSQNEINNTHKKISLSLSPYPCVVACLNVWTFIKFALKRAHTRISQ